MVAEVPQPLGQLSKFDNNRKIQHGNAKKTLKPLWYKISPKAIDQRHTHAYRQSVVRILCKLRQEALGEHETVTEIPVLSEQERKRHLKENI